MGWNDHLNDFNYVNVCKKCRRRYKVYETEQIPGFRDTEYEICPYCGEINRASMEYEFSTEKMENENEN